jgi:molecular chaperone GrpE
VNDQRNTGAGAAPDEERGDDGTVNGGAGASDAPGGGTGAGAGVGAAAEDLDGVRRQRDEYYDLLLRKTAEFDNYRRRIEKERRELSDYAAAELLRELLPLGDDLDRALAAAPDAQSGADPVTTLRGYRQGIELIQRQFGELLRKRGVTQVEALGADFDPHFHQAVSQEPSQTHREGEIIEEYGRGYKLGDRLLRPAMVKVATRE